MAQISLFDMMMTARLILGQPKNHVFSQPPGSDSRIQGHPLIEPLIDGDRRVIRGIGAPSVYKKVLPAYPRSWQHVCYYTYYTRWR